MCVANDASGDTIPGEGLMNSWERYVYHVEWSDEDGEFVGLCVELPGISWLAKSRGEALKGIVVIGRDAVAILEESGEAPPGSVLSCGRTVNGREPAPDPG
jgi:hypothetical protein